MQFKNLFNEVEILDVLGDVDFDILQITDQSQKVEKGSLFFVVKGNSFDGSEFLKEVERKGAIAVVTEEKLDTGLCQIIVSDVRSAMAICAKQFYGNPQEDLRIVGLVGTNGKTSTCHILSNILTNGGFKVGLMGTIGTYYDGVVQESSLTTLGSIELYRTMRNMVDRGINVLCMEVSAHAIEQKRCYGVFFDYLVFTNCTEDHLDYFNSMREYEEVKKSIFSFDNCKYMIVNSDDKVGREIIKSNEGNLITYGIDNPSDVFAINIQESENGISYVINLFDEIYEIKSKLFGLCNVYNTLSACTVASILGVNIHHISLTLNKLSPISGRAELVSTVNGGKIFIDYAHTPDGLKRTLISMKKICKGRLICLFGCGGNRDKQKRGIMGRISGSIADFTVITSDNPRFEEPCDIIREIENGLKTVSRNYITIVDRKNAIIYAMDLLKSGDVLLIAGKGAETYQEKMGQRTYFSDKNVVVEYVEKLGGQNCK